MYFVDDEHAGAHKAQQISNDMAHLMNIHQGPYRRIQRRQQLSVERLLIRLWRHLHRDDLHLLHTDSRVKDRRMRPSKLAKQLRLAHASSGVQKQTWHPIALRILQQLVETAEDCLGPLVADPSLRLDSPDAFL